MEKLLEFKKNIITWYPIEKNASVLQVGEDILINSALKEKTENVDVIDSIGNVNENLKYDYITLIGGFENIEQEDEVSKILDVAKDHLNKKGKILLAMKNKFGMKYFAGDKFNNYNSFETIEFEKENVLSKSKIESILTNLKLKYKFYYPLPDYEYANVIYTNDFMPTEDSIEARDITLCSNNAFLSFSEKNAYKQILKNQKDLFPFFANSYFIEIGNQDDFSDVRFVSFGIIRKKEHRIKTIITKNSVYKSANDELAKEHVETIGKNISILNELKIPNIGKVLEGNIIECKYMNNAQSYDEYLMDLYVKEGLNSVIQKIVDYKDEILNKLYSEDYKTNKTVFEKYKVYVPDRIKAKMHFVKHGLLDLIFQNILVENGMFGKKNYAFDQEWYEENVPIEFILYRSLLYFTELKNVEDINVLYKTFGLDEFLRYFEGLEDKLQKELTDEEVWKLHFDAVNKIHYDSKLLNDYEEKQKEASDYKKQISDLNYAISQKNQEIDYYTKQISTISNSLSWKLTKPFRMIAWILNPTSGASFIDRIMPPGGRRRAEYDKKQTEKKYEKRVENYFKLTDEETAEYWKGIDHRKYLKYEKFLKKQADDELTDYEKYQFNNMLSDQEYDLQEKAKFKIKPKISIIIPLYNTNIDYFRELLYTIHLQSYKNWELCLADGSQEELTEIKEMVEKDKRIKYKFLGKNGGISENTNAAAEMATGDYIFLCDHDDMLELNTLFEVVRIINEQNADFIYSDEDKFHFLDESYFAPHFKPDFAPDTLRANNYICHICCMKKSLFDETGGFVSEYNGAQDFDIILKATEKAQTIVHIPKVLYHWRISQESTALNMEAKPYAIEAGKKAVEAHLERTNKKGTVFFGTNIGTYGIDYEVEGNPKVTILIPNKDNMDLLDRCVTSILEKTTYSNYEIVIIENNSETEEIFEHYKELEKNDKVKVIYYKEEGFNYSKIINFGVKNTDGDFIVQLNNDTELLTDNWLERMIGFAQREDVGAVGVKLYYPDYTIQHAGIVVGACTVAAHVFRGVSKSEHGYFGRENLIQDLSAVTAACIMTKRSIYEEVGYMNEDFAVAFNDIDFCLKIRKAGKLIVYNPNVELIHYESASRGLDDVNSDDGRFKREIDLFLSTWKEFLDKGDEYYNKNLSLDNDKYEVKTDKVI